MAALERSLAAIYRRLHRRFGPQHWWPGETRFEVAVGAILTQGTSWVNASRAVQALKRRGFLNPRGIDRLPRGRLARLIRSSGYFNQKAERLHRFVRYLLRRHQGRMSRMRGASVQQLRSELLALSGVGPETADSILLYALQKPVFVVDAYTRRVLARHSLIPWEASYDQIQALLTKGQGPHRGSVAYFNEYHALFVQLGKSLCRPHPLCSACPLREIGHLKLETSPGKAINQPPL